MRDCRFCQEVNASPPKSKSGVKLKLFVFWVFFFWFSGLERGEQSARAQERAGGRVGVETPATRRHMFAYTSLMKSGHAGGGDKWL